MRRQKCVWWQRERDDFGQPLNDKFGKPKFKEPVQLKCRWDDAVEQITNAAGEVVTCQSKVYPEKEMSIGDRLWKGTLVDARKGQRVPDSKDVYPVIRFDINPNLKASESLNTAYL